jgi:hypothetical protein
VNLCSIEGCHRASRKRTWCTTHYERWRKHGDPHYKVVMPDSCTVEGCNNPYKARGYCAAHWAKDKKYGNPLGHARVQTIQERMDKLTKKGPHCWVWQGASDWTGYGKIAIGGRDGRPYQAHRIAYELAKGPIPDGLYIDHMCPNRSCVNPSHLRAVTNKQNMENPSGLRADNTSGFQGVMWDKRDKKWRAYANHNGRYHSAGYHSTKEAAAEAAHKLRLELFTHNELDKAKDAA